jgi:hypothetical protein
MAHADGLCADALSSTLSLCVPTGLLRCSLPALRGAHICAFVPLREQSTRDSPTRSTHDDARTNAHHGGGTAAEARSHQRCHSDACRGVGGSVPPAYTAAASWATAAAPMGMPRVRDEHTVHGCHCCSCNSSWLHCIRRVLRSCHCSCGRLCLPAHAFLRAAQPGSFAHHCCCGGFLRRRRQCFSR